jgi:hypothetical protein
VSLGAGGSHRATPADGCTPYTWSMPTPVGPIPPGPDDPDMWDWGEEDEDDVRPRLRPWRLVVVVSIVVALVLLLVVSVL